MRFTTGQSDPAGAIRRALAAAAVLGLFGSAGCSSGRSGAIAPATRGSPAPARTSVGALATPTGDRLAHLERQILDKVNDHRVSHGLPPLAWSDAVADAARRHSGNMASGAIAFGHDGFADRVSTIRKSIRLSHASEIVAQTPGRDAAAVVESWFDSPGHMAHIEGDFQVTGVGVAEGPKYLYSTEIFVKQR